MALTSIDLDDHWNRVLADPHDFPAFEIGARVSSVERVFVLGEDAIPIFQSKALTAAHADLARYKDIYEAADLRDWRRALDNELQVTIPSAFHCTSVFMLSAAKEQSLRSLVGYIDRRRPSAVSAEAMAQGRLPAEDPLKTLCRKLNLPALGDSRLRAALRMLSDVRNTLAHAGGYVHSEGAERRERLLRVAATESGVMVEGGRLIVGRPFLGASLSAVVELLNLAMSAVASALPLQRAP